MPVLIAAAPVPLPLVFLGFFVVPLNQRNTRLHTPVLCGNPSAILREIQHPGAPPDARFRPPEQGSCGGRVGGVSFVQRFGASLNAHLHYHICLVDGVFSKGATGFAEDAEPIGARSAHGGELSTDGTVEQESMVLRFHEAIALGEAEVVALQEVARPPQ